MTTFKILTRSETNSTYSTYSINEYEINSDTTHEQVLIDFLSAENFKHEDFHKIIRLNDNPERNFLGHALNLEQIELSDFRKLTKNKLLEFFETHLKLQVPDAYVREEKHLQAKFIRSLKNADSNLFCLISRDFFDTDLSHEVYFENHKLLYDGIIYNPYFVILWFDEQNLLNVCEYLSD